ncbi:MAG TPA: flagellar basal body rod protein FlgB [Candidatus Baltobacteraceae bacterium]|nr:flagellar basal body rod protein FlgB [Candidatus Baltobacteraceae bacterium]
MNDISAVSFGQTVDTLNNAIAGSGLEQTAIAENIANVNTPGYARQSVSFKNALAAAEGDPAGEGLGMKTDDGRQFALGTQATVQPFDPQTQIDTTDKMRADGSNVDVDQETAELAQNSGYSQTMSQLLQVQFMRLREAITEQPR